MSWIPKKQVVVPVDFSEESFDAVDTALHLVDGAANITVVHVLHDLVSAEPYGMWREVDHETRSRHAAKALRERLAGKKYEGINIDILFGDPGHEIADLAQREGSELIVLPSHGRTGMTRALIGSVAERVVRLAHCPVLVLRQ
jgi:nucleotide-binding universal stress UspA family protein